MITCETINPKDCSCEPPKQAAEKLEVSPSLVYSLCASGKLRHCRVGHGQGRIRIPEDAIQEYLARCTFGGREAEAKPVEPGVPKLKHLQL